MPLSERIEALFNETERIWKARVLGHWSPPWAPHVVGFYSDRDDISSSDKVGQKWRTYCLTCNTEQRGVCPTGAVLNHVTHFAQVHLHRDPMELAPRVLPQG